jgi:hypothetical protein
MRTATAGWRFASQTATGKKSDYHVDTLQPHGNDSRMAPRVRAVGVHRIAHDVWHRLGPAPHGGRGSDNHARSLEETRTHNRGDGDAGSAAGDIVFSGFRAQLVAKLGIPE